MKLIKKQKKEAVKGKGNVSTSQIAENIGYSVERNEWLDKGTSSFNLSNELHKIKVLIPLTELVKIPLFNEDLKNVFGISSPIYMIIHWICMINLLKY